MPNFNKYTQFQGSNPFGSQAKMLYHLDRLQEYVETGDTTPIFVEFSLTDKCNLACKWCISENCQSPAQINKVIAVNFLRDFKKMGGKAVTFSGGGEPTLHPDFEAIADSALLMGLDVGLMTNGAYSPLLNRVISKFKWVRFSIDTLDHDKYRKWKGRDRLEDVCRNILWLKDTPVKVGLNVNVGPEHDLQDIRDILQQAPYVDYIQFRPVLPRYYKDEKPELNEDVWTYLRRYCSDNPKVNLSLDKLKDLETESFFEFDSCEGHFFNPIVHANGDVAVCMYHPRDTRFIFGNLNQENFKTIWKSQRRQDVISALRGIDYCSECQICCKLTELNKLLQFVNTPNEESDINFL